MISKTKPPSPNPYDQGSRAKTKGIGVEISVRFSPQRPTPIGESCSRKGTSSVADMSERSTPTSWAPPNSIAKGSGNDSSQNSDGPRKSSACESSKVYAKRRRGLPRIPHISDQPCCGQDQKRSGSGDVLDKPAKVSKTDESPQSISLSASDVGTSPLQELSLESLTGAGPSVESTVGPPVAVEYKAKTGHRKVRREMTAPSPGNGRLCMKLAPLRAKEGPAKLKRDQTSDVRSRKKPTPLLCTI